VLRNQEIMAGLALSQRKGRPFNPTAWLGAIRLQVCGPERWGSVIFGAGRSETASEGPWVMRGGLFWTMHQVCTIDFGKNSTNGVGIHSESVRRRSAVEVHCWRIKQVRSFGGSGLFERIIRLGCREDGRNTEEWL